MDLTHVRPVTPSSDPITRDLLSEEGGPVQVGALLDIGDATPSPSPPETEDHPFATRDAKLVELLDGDTYVKLLASISHPDVHSAFGSSLHRVGDHGYAIDAGQGERSLAVVRAQETPTLVVTRWGKLRLKIPDLGATLTVTDIRFVQDDHQTVRTDIVHDVNARLANGVETYLMLGLARAVQFDWDTCKRHWLQVNGLCLVDRPVGPSP